MIPQSNLTWLMFKAFTKTTVKGGAITLTSTIVSCALACYIERGAHRAVYKYFPEKYANVERANGLTQDQLDAVRIFRQPIESPTTKKATTTATASSATANTLSFQDQEFHLPETHSTFSTQQAEPSAFWREESFREKSTPLFSWKLQDSSFRSTEILACAITG